MENGKITDRFSTFVNPQVPIPFRIEQLTSINDSMVMDARPIEEILPEFLKFCEGATMVAHNADFDMSFIIENCNRMGIPNDFTYVDTVGMARFLLPALNRFKLDTVARQLAFPWIITIVRLMTQSVRHVFSRNLWKCAGKEILRM